METLDPSVFIDLEDKDPASHLSGSDDLMGGKPGGPFTLHFFTESVGGGVFNTELLRFVGANRAVGSHGCPERAFVCPIGED